jgi:hypothetical protein
VKELKFNLQYLIKKKELYFAFIGVMIVNIIHVFLVMNQYSNWADDNYFTFYTGEYNSILYNNDITLYTIIIIAFPILLGMILSDSSWLDHKMKTDNFLYTRLHYKKNLFIRLILSMVITFIIAFIGFMFNYLSLISIFGSGNDAIIFQSLAYDLTVIPEYFLDIIRNSNPSLFIVLISCHVSLLLGLLSGLSYVLSFFTRQRLVIYFQVLLFIIVLELVLSFIGDNSFSIIKQMQPFSKFSFFHALIVYGLLLILNIGLFLFSTRKKGVKL